MKNFNIIDKQGIKLNTANTYVNDDINIGLSEADKGNLVAENIKKDVTILGVTGIHEGGTNEGGASLNLAYGETPPTDTSKIWLQCVEPSGVEVQNYLGECAVSNVANYGAISNPITSSNFYSGYYSSCYIGNNQIAIVGYNHIRIYDLTAKSYIADYTISVGTNKYYSNVLYKDNVLYFCYENKLYSYDLTTQTLTQLYTYGSSSFRFTFIFFHSETEIDILFGYDSANNGFRWRYNLSTTANTQIASVNQYVVNCRNHTIKANNTVYNFYMYTTTSTNYYTWKYNLLSNSITKFTSFYDFMTDLGWTTYLYSSGIYDGERYIYLIGGYGNYNGNSSKISDLIIKYDTVNDSFEVLDNKLLGVKYYHFTVLVDNRVYIFGGQDDRKNNLDYFDISYPLPQNNAIITIANYKDDNALPLINTEKLKLNSNIASAYLGNANNLAEKVNAYYWNGYGWVGINCEDYTIYFSWDTLPTLSCALHNNVVIDLSQYYHTNGEPTLSASVAGGGMTSNINGTVLDITNNSSSSAQTIVITATVNNTEYQTALTVDVPATTTVDDLS